MSGILICCLLTFCFSYSVHSQGKLYPEHFTVVIENPLNEERTDVFVLIPENDIRSIAQKFNRKGFVVLDVGHELASQYNSRDPSLSGIALVLPEIAAGESKTIQVRYNPFNNVSRDYERKTQAELSHKSGGSWKDHVYIGGSFKNVDFLQVPPEHMDHSSFIRYEGPGWESDKVAYRFYLDQRNAVDVFGKKVSEPVLQGIGLNNFDSYHEMQPWGMDVMKVGESLGLGSIASLVNGSAHRVEITDSISCRILENGSLYSSVQTNYSGWKINNMKHDLRVLTSIHAGTRLTRQELIVTAAIANISTGIVLDSVAEVLSSKGHQNAFGYLATYGKQSLNGDELGLVVFFDPATFKSFATDRHSHIVELTPKDQKLTYYFAAAWVLEHNGLRNRTEFVEYVQRVSRELANPIRVKIVKQ